MAPRFLFDQELNELNQELAKMGEMVEAAIEKSFYALDTQNEVLAKEIIRGDREIDERERKIESHCLSMMLRQQPVARDLRHISTALKVVTDLERMGDHAADIADLTVKLGKEGASLSKVSNHLPSMVQEVKQMVHDAIRAFIERDTHTAEQFELRDDVIDAYFEKVKAEVTEFLKKESEQSDTAVNLLMFAKYLERIADHAVNVCEWAEFSDTGTVNHITLL